LSVSLRARANSSTVLVPRAQQSDDLVPRRVEIACSTDYRV